MAVGRSVGQSEKLKTERGLKFEVAVGRSVGRWELSFQLIPVQAGRRED